MPSSEERRKEMIMYNKKLKILYILIVLHRYFVFKRFNNRLILQKHFIPFYALISLYLSNDMLTYSDIVLALFL